VLQSVPRASKFSTHEAIGLQFAVVRSAKSDKDTGHNHSLSRSRLEEYRGMIRG
jgi:hypothetical protein